MPCRRSAAFETLDTALHDAGIEATIHDRVSFQQLKARGRASYFVCLWRAGDDSCCD